VANTAARPTRLLSKMCATTFEFKRRDIIIRIIYAAAIACYLFDSDSIAYLLGLRLSAAFGGSELAWERAALFAGAGLVFLAAAIRSWATAYLRYDVMRNPRIHTDRLISDGPFAYVRNPLYIGNFCVVAGVSLMLPRSGMVVLVMGSLLLVHRLVRREELELALTHGQAFHEYCRNVPRWLPSFPSSRPQTYKPSFRDGVVGELLLWIIGVALAVYAATDNVAIFGIIFISAFIPGAGRRLRRMWIRRMA
jgi:protein-S-isoprenylcysteine O-methyltransferase Ste14